MSIGRGVAALPRHLLPPGGREGGRLELAGSTGQQIKYPVAFKDAQQTPIHRAEFWF